MDYCKANAIVVHGKAMIDSVGHEFVKQEAEDSKIQLAQQFITLSNAIQQVPFSARVRRFNTTYALHFIDAD